MTLVDDKLENGSYSELAWPLEEGKDEITEAELSDESYSISVSDHDSNDTFEYQLSKLWSDVYLMHDSSSIYNETLYNSSRYLLSNDQYHGFISNDFILFISLMTLVVFLFYELCLSDRSLRKKRNPSHASIATVHRDSLRIVPMSKQHIPLPFPVYSGHPNLIPLVMNVTALCRYIPSRLVIYDEILNPVAHDDPNNVQDANNAYDASDQPSIGLPNIPGMEYNSSLTLKMLQEMSKEFPKSEGYSITKSDVVRFLVARKGNYQLSTEMMRKSLVWHKQHLPLSPSPELLRCLSTKCFFPHGVDRDGAPVLFFRGALYDSTKASSEMYVLSAAHAIDYALKHSKHTAITCMVHAIAVPGAPNEGTDINFIKGFVQVCQSFVLFAR